MGSREESRLISCVMYGKRNVSMLYDGEKFHL